eukprot:gene2228-2402_t
MSKEESVKIVLLGDPKVGKTNLMKVYLDNEFTDEYKPSNLESYDTILAVEDMILKVTVLEASVQDELLHLAFSGSNLFILSYSVTDPDSFNHLTNWKKLMDEHCPNIPFIILALKIDEYKQKDNKFISKKQGESVSIKLKSNGFYELSPKKPKGINDLFQKCEENL